MLNRPPKQVDETYTMRTGCWLIAMLLLSAAGIWMYYILSSMNTPLLWWSFLLGLVASGLSITFTLKPFRKAKE